MDKTRKDVARTSKRLHLGLKILKEIISKGKSDNNKCGLSYISKVKTPISMKTTFVMPRRLLYLWRHPLVLLSSTLFEIGQT